MLNEARTPKIEFVYGWGLPQKNVLIPILSIHYIHWHNHSVKTKDNKHFMLLVFISLLFSWIRCRTSWHCVFFFEIFARIILYSLLCMMLVAYKNECFTIHFGWLFYMADYRLFLAILWKWRYFLLSRWECLNLIEYVDCFSCVLNIQILNIFVFRLKQKWTAYTCL